MDMWEPFRSSILQWSPQCAIVYIVSIDMQHANKAVDEVRRAEFFRKGARMRGVVEGKAPVAIDPMGKSGTPTNVSN